MSLKAQIQNDLKEFLRAGKKFEVGVLRMILSSIHNREIEKRSKLSKSEPLEKLEELSKLAEEEVVEVLSSEAKKRREAVLLVRRSLGEGGEKEKIESFINKEKMELEILKRYLPEQLSEEKIEKLVKEAIEKIGATEPKDMGRVMRELMPKVKGRADGGLVNEIVKKLLESLSAKTSPNGEE